MSTYHTYQPYFTRDDEQSLLLFHPVPVCGVGCVAQQGISAADTPLHMKVKAVVIGYYRRVAIPVGNPFHQ